MVRDGHVRGAPAVPVTDGSGSGRCCRLRVHRAGRRTPAAEQQQDADQQSPEHEQEQGRNGVGAEERPVDGERRGSDGGTGREPPGQHPAAERRDRDGRAEYGQRIKAEEGGGVGDRLDRPACGPRGDARRLQREFGGAAAELEDDAGNPGGERGAGQPAIRSFGISQQAAQVSR